MNFSRCCTITIALLSLVAAPITSFAQEACSADDIAAAISAAETDGECSADGSFISGDSVVDNLKVLCANKGNRCRACFNLKGKAAISLVRGLVAQRLLSADNANGLRAAISQAVSETCVSAEPTPVPTPEASETPSPTATPKPSATPNSAELVTKAVLHSIKEGCCSPTAEAGFNDCRASTVAYGVAHGLSSNAASSILAAPRLRLCAAN